MEQRRSSPIAARIAAGLVFLFGIALLGGTFYLAFRMFTDPRVGLLPPPGAGQPAPDLGTQALIILGRVGLLLIMTYAGSAIASKGIHLYQATQHPRAE